MPANFAVIAAQAASISCWCTASVEHNCHCCLVIPSTKLTNNCSCCVHYFGH
jgi:hypothetical protein